MNRRRFLQCGGAAVAAPSIMGLAPAATATRRLAEGFRSAPDGGFDGALRLISGAMPNGLVGTYFVNGPAGFDRGGERYDHWFDGDGMVHAFAIDGRGISHRGRFVDTAKRQRETAAGRFVVPAFGTVPASAEPLAGPDEMNVANISVRPVGQTLWALWEGGSATAIDPDTLSTIGPVALGEGLDGVPFSAHPRLEPDGTMWNFGHDPFGGRVLLFELAPGGDLRRVKLLQDMPRGMIHDFISTSRHLILIFPPFVFGGFNGKSFVDQFSWHGDEARQAVVVRKDTLEVVRRYEVPAAFTFHYSNGWEEADGTLRFGACTYDDVAFVTRDARALLRGKVPTSHARFEHWTLYPDGRADVRRETGYAEFPVHRAQDAGRSAEFWHVGRRGDDDLLGGSLIARNPAGEVSAHWTGPEGLLLGEQVVATGTDDRAYLLGTAFDAAAGRSLFMVTDAGAVDRGPLAIWQLPYTIPVPLHGTFVPRRA